ncbi:transporter substrate-binding domain-containing protein [Marinobacter sp. ATCH36]|uniref:substrate-binding periplasmic protein n=1 Tax=Marinobacter sp. ATCH36 TaxID=2945106 RepID=UPI0020227F0C|nr:transporter substrate-binding domain-containing protein [Marinobacter sp. ATCH36]MCL7943181.1 transporter substrate-binding domain-containing protein [Marinobacter sp. ATCH36]
MPRLVCIVLVMLLVSGCSPPDSETAAAVAETDTETQPTASIIDNQSQPGTIVIAADPWCPHNCEAGADHEGYMVDIAREILVESGFTVKYINLSWARALQMTREGRLDAVVGAFRTDAPDFVFPDTPQGHSSIALFTHPDNNWTYSGLESLEDQQLLVINGYSYTRELDRYIEQNRGDRERVWIISGPSPLDRAIELLEQDRTDIFVEDEYVMAWWAMSAGKSVNPPRAAGLIDDTDVFVAFSPARKDAKELARLLSEGTRQRIDNGRLQEILETYGLSLRTETR